MFKPRLGDLFDEVLANPKLYEKKRGKLYECRAAEVRFNRTAVWRCVFRIDEGARIVHILALAPHDVAYAEAERRL